MDNCWRIVRLEDTAPTPCKASISYVRGKSNQLEVIISARTGNDGINARNHGRTGILIPRIPCPQ